VQGVSLGHDTGPSATAVAGNERLGFGTDCLHKATKRPG